MNDAITMLDLMLCLSHAMDLISVRVNNHHRRVSYIASAIARELGLTPEQQADIAMAAAVHDAGALSLRERLETLDFDLVNPHEHALRGEFLLSPFPPFRETARIVRHHHARWDHGRGAEENGEEVPLGSHIIHLADRVDVLLQPDRPFLQQSTGIMQSIIDEAGIMFPGDLVEVLRGVASREFFWFDLALPSHGQIMQPLGTRTMVLGLEEMKDLTEVFARIIDFRSRFTTIHSTGVAATAVKLAREAGFPDEDVAQMRIAGQLHDLGKLAVPTEILEKPENLDDAEFSIIKSHTYHTCRLLETVPGFGKITRWAAFHHERPDGTGYPFHISGKQIDTGCSIMTVADVFTALTENRPYRKGMQQKEALKVLDGMAARGTVDGDVANLVRKNLAELDAIRHEAQIRAEEWYEQFAQL